MPNEESKVIAKTNGKESAKEDIETQANDRLVKFFEILIQIDQRQHEVIKRYEDVMNKSDDRHNRTNHQ